MVIEAKIAVSALRAIADEKLGHFIGGYGPGGVVGIFHCNHRYGAASGLAAYEMMLLRSGRSIVHLK
jgi:hypothetical protein